MTAHNQLCLTLAQFASTNEPAHNLERIDQCLLEAKTAGSAMIIFPENVYCRGDHAEIRAAAKSKDFYLERLGKLSRQHGIWSLWGGLPVRNADGIYNMSLIYNSTGRLIVAYRKIHLFKFARPDQPAIDETSLYLAGAKPVDFQFHDWNIGLSICYDLRFPELFRAYAGADIMVCTADFTHYTGQSHWEVLLRARAIENQCFVLGVNQTGTNPTTQVQAYGHTMVVDPWGEILTSLNTQTQCCHCRLDKTVIQTKRERLPALQSIQHRTQWS